MASSATWILVSSLGSRSEYNYLGALLGGVEDYPGAVLVAEAAAVTGPGHTALEVR